MDKDNLEKYNLLYKLAIDELLPLMDSESLDIRERVTLSLQFAKSRGDVGFFEKAFNNIKLLDPESRLEPLMELLDSLSVQIDDLQSVNNS